MKNAQEHNEYTEKENDQLRTDALMMINALRSTTRGCCYARDLPLGRVRSILCVGGRQHRTLS